MTPHEAVGIDTRHVAVAVFVPWRRDWHGRDGAGAGAARMAGRSIPVAFSRAGDGPVAVTAISRTFAAFWADDRGAGDGDSADADAAGDRRDTGIDRRHDGQRAGDRHDDGPDGRDLLADTRDPRGDDAGHALHVAEGDGSTEGDGDAVSSVRDAGLGPGVRPAWRCDTCAHWHEFGAQTNSPFRTTGRCTKIRTYAESLLSVSPHPVGVVPAAALLATYSARAELIGTERGSLATAPDFGCALWEASGDAPP